MKKLIFLFILLPLFLTQTASSQKFYPMSSWEFLFQFADVEKASEPNISNRLRFTIVINVGQYFHYDFTNNIGLYSGLAVRNVGFIYDTPEPTKTIRRSYTLGVPLAFKVGAFDKHLYFLGGAEYELLFHYRARMWESNNRDGAVVKHGEWFSAKTKRFVPSVFAGVQFPGGFNVKFKYYLQHFLNTSFVGTDLGESVDFSDYTKIDMFYVSLCWQFRTDQWKKYISYDEMATTF